MSLELRPADPQEAARVPTRRTVRDVLAEFGVLPEDFVYVGQGRHSHRVPTTIWKSPKVPGHSCKPSEWLPSYVQRIKSTLSSRLAELGRTLVCDCPLEQMCKADVLAGLICAEGPPQVSSGDGRGRMAANLATRSDAEFTGFMSQESLVLRFRKLFPAQWFHDFKFPMVEDLGCAIRTGSMTSNFRWLRTSSMARATDARSGQGLAGALGALPGS